MNYCINPDCKQRKNHAQLEYCQACGTPLLIHEQYRLIKPLRRLDPRTYTDIFEVDNGGNRKVMKILKDNSPRLVKMFEREALTLRLLNHPGIPKIEPDGYFTFIPNDSSLELHCLVMEKIEGDNLEQWIEHNGAISQLTALNWLRQLIEILEQVHQNGFFHRDIKPSNIMLKPDGKLVLIDFGSVREISNTYLAKIKGRLNLTSVFSSGYTSQEQLDGQALPQSDFYALGRTFVYLLTRKSPVELPKDSMTSKLIWQNKAPQVSKVFADFIDELMAPIPADRPQNTAVILPYLTVKGLFFKSIVRLLNSPKFKLTVAGFLTLGVSVGLIYRGSFPLIAQHYYEQGVKELKAQRLDSARKKYEQALRFNNKDARIYNDMGLICQIQRNFACAQVKYEHALKLNPDNPVACYNLGGFYDDSGDFERAEKQYQLAAQSGSPVAVNAISDLARLHILKGDSATAINLSLQGLQKTEKPKVQSALSKNLGWARWMQTDYNQAETDLRQAIKLNSERADAYCLLAQVLEAQSNKRGALMVWKDCLSHDSKRSVEVKIWQATAIQRLKDAGAK